LAAWAGVRFRRAQQGAEFNAALGLAALSLLGYGVALSVALLWGKGAS
jgi:hypothetical protein